MFKNMDEAWADYSNQCIDEDDLEHYTASDIRDDFYCGAIALMTCIRAGVPLDVLEEELQEWHDEAGELTI